MQVRLVSYTQPAPIMKAEGINNAQELVAYCARVSNPTNQLNSETSANLIKYLINHQHWSPLETVHATVEIESTRDIVRQILRHRSFTFQEFSQRYADPVESLGFELSECRLQHPTNRQSSLKSENPELNDWWDWAQQQVIDLVEDLYTQAGRRGIAKETSRKLCPEGLTKSKIYMTGSIRSFIHYCEIRTGVETQKEHRLVAHGVAAEIARIFPMIGEIENG